MRKLAYFVALAALLTGCAIPGGVRPGVNALPDTVTPLLGVPYEYEFVLIGPDDVALFAANATFTGEQIGSDRYRWSGAYSAPITAENLAVIQGMQADDVNDTIQIQGDLAIIPAENVTNSAGSTLSSFGFGTRTTYAPNDCFNVIGTCRYSETSGGVTVHKMATTSVFNGIWTRLESPDPDFPTPDTADFASFIYSVDAYGSMIDADATLTGADGFAVTFRIRLMNNPQGD